MTETTKATFGCKFRDALNERVVEYPFALSMVSRTKGRNVVDVGSGPTPAFWYILTNIGFNAIALDPMAKSSIKFSSKTNKFKRKSIVNSGMPSNYFDIVFCISTLEHVKEYEKAILEMNRICKPQGLIVVTTPFCCNEYIKDTIGLPKTKKYSCNHAYSLSQYEKWTNIIGTIEEKKIWRAWSGPSWRKGERFFIPKPVSEEKDADLIAVCWRKEG
ncbi:MAG: class I SAM-dependent methyltransferase [Candidatus Woesearchaeota archaeon]|jgi:ubiquinone/menaquinone biosynthesis C-methylase UbiE